MKSIYVSPLMPLYGLLSISFLHLILLSCHFLFLKCPYRGRPPFLQEAEHFGAEGLLAVIWHWSIAYHSWSPSHLISHVEISGIWYLCTASINHPETLQLCTLKFPDRLWQMTSWMNEGYCWNRRTQIGQREACRIIGDPCSEQRKKLQGRNQLCSTTLTIRFSQWFSGYLLSAHHLFNEPFFDRLPFLHLCDQFVYVAAHRRFIPPRSQRKRRQPSEI